MAVGGGFDYSTGPDMPRASESGDPHGRNERIDLLASKLEKRAVELARRREPLSRRWYADIQQYEGRYPEDVRVALERDPSASKLFVNMTRPKTRIMKARLADVLFPTDDLNWDIEPTPDPELAEPMTVGRAPDPSGATSVPVVEGPPPQQAPPQPGAPAAGRPARCLGRPGRAGPPSRPDRSSSPDRRRRRRSRRTRKRRSARPRARPPPP